MRFHCSLRLLDYIFQRHEPHNLHAELQAAAEKYSPADPTTWSSDCGQVWYRYHQLFQANTSEEHITLLEHKKKGFRGFI